jgi:beta-mannosidase
MQKVSLNGAWRLRQVGKAEEIDAVVPGGVHTDLIAAGLLPDPFYGDNELRVQWVAESDWQYTRVFQVSAELLIEDSVMLVCDGLDTLGEARLNGVSLGRFENMFRQYRWEVKGLLKEGENELVIHFDSPVKYAAEKETAFALSGVQPWSIMGGPYLRKAPCHFGWDWGPMLPPVGIWKDIRLEGHSIARFEEVHLRQKLEGGKGLLTASVASVSVGAQQPLRVVMTVTSPSGEKFEDSAPLEGSDGLVTVEVSNPQLWWPNGYGEQPLYTVQVSLRSDDHLVDVRDFQIGFRTIELRQAPDEWGESFTFLVNGTPIFAKGADWIPADSFPTRISDDYMDHLLRSSKEAHMNMMRVWGGGFYEEERFYFCLQ